MSKGNPITIKITKTKGAKTMNEITYTMVGDYNLPNLTLPQQSEVTLGRWSQMRRTYLKQHHKILYYNFLTKGILTQHLAEVQERATDLEESLVKQMAAKAGLTEQMKAEDMMKWVGLMNNIRNSAQEIVKEQVIFN
ncbi:TnpV protein [Holdemanella porci]|uniref:TnpV protein n=1 Tax=Bacillota TaxID=1239 RepID=UPI003AB39D64